jgi:hypothetical protein
MIDPVTGKPDTCKHGSVRHLRPFLENFPAASPCQKQLNVAFYSLSAL